MLCDPKPVAENESRALVRAAPLEPDARPAVGPADPILAELAQAVAAALVAQLAPWLNRIAADLGRVAPATATPPVVAPPPILLSADDARAYCGGLAKSTWSDFDTRGVIPAPVRVGGRVFWRRADLDLWTAKDCPGRGRFDVILDAERPTPSKNGAKK